MDLSVVKVEISLVRHNSRKTPWISSVLEHRRSWSPKDMYKIPSNNWWVKKLLTSIDIAEELPKIADSDRSAALHFQTQLEL